MSQRIFRSCQEPKREGLTADDRWNGDDKGVIAAWERGREIRRERPETAEKVDRGELPMEGWKGGVEKRTKTNKKHGTLWYLAQWQGLRGEDLDIDLSKEKELVCSRTGMTVVYTRDREKWVTP